MYKAFLVTITILLSFFLTAAPVLADIVKPPVIPDIPHLPTISSATQEEGGGAIRTYIFETFAGSFLKGFLGLMAAASVVFIIIGGIQMLLAFGNEEALGKAKKTILWALLGLVIAILSAAIVRIVTTIPFQPPPAS